LCLFARPVRAVLLNRVKEGNTEAGASKFHASASQSAAVGSGFVNSLS
jgi:hypothetical protein